MSLGLDRRIASTIKQYRLQRELDEAPLLQPGPPPDVWAAWLETIVTRAAVRAAMPARSSAGAHSWVCCGEPLARSVVDIPVHRDEPAISHRCRGATTETLRHARGRVLAAVAVRARPAAQACRHGRDGRSHSIVAPGSRCGRRVAPKSHRPGAARRDRRSPDRTGIGRRHLPLQMRLDASVGERHCRPHVFRMRHRAYSLSRQCLWPAANAPHSRSGPLS